MGHNIEFCFKIYGYKDTLDIIIPDVDNNLYKNLDLDFKCRPRIQYMLYQHNLHDVINVIELCEKKKGIALGNYIQVYVYITTLMFGSNTSFILNPVSLT